MITGVVNANREAIIRLVVTGPGGQRQNTEAIIDTGFTGFLTLPPTRIAALGLSWLSRQSGILADGSVDIFDVVRCERDVGRPASNCDGGGCGHRSVSGNEPAGPSLIADRRSERWGCYR